MAFNDQLNSAKQSTMTFFRRLFIGIVVLAVLGLLLGFLATKVPYSEGERAGVVSKFSRKGYIFKTDEGELNVGAQGQVGNMANNLWAFTVDSDDPAISKKLEDAMLTGRRLRLHYEQRYLKFFWMGDTEYFVTRVDEAP
ncbi:hypothetical protein LV89_00203 [Arcicella aurantiaca]|uniref:6-phosphogluconate dehydrogenase n=1 Tax=Arcicella aurantiaca TaxID=591202 RepID=A0A316EF96_9BACT|nr:hypothetical protein [Arcicella aurantiaca]PWK29363.1 hypothetical protein LV89_00203 [Arcicella aurantiaca]